ncbi:hypothetical protein M514_13825 [Trichuris suis]|uniref:Uncharacterized protein n=1 Tax=Trichuris suis TaxID=68888 RepID=A0A085MPR5_9BILA|nr:hypothetical protein M513_13825 [Trichuris suis]KFD59211.1 hypothetical protein M514_13825 [Trichuris suis]
MTELRRGFHSYDDVFQVQCCPEEVQDDVSLSIRRHHRFLQGFCPAYPLLWQLTRWYSLHRQDHYHCYQHDRRARVAEQCLCVHCVSSKGGPYGLGRKEA